MATPITIKINDVVRRCLDFLADGKGNDALTAVAKLLFRLGAGRHRVSEIRQALILTPAEEAAVLRGAAGFVVKLAGRFFLVAAITDLVVKFLEGEGTTRTPEERLAIVGAHFVKGSGPLTIAFAASEQLLFGLHDAFFPDENLLEAGASILETAFDFLPPVLVGPPIPPDVELVSGDFDQLAPVIEPMPDTGQTFPGGPSHRLFRSIDP